MPYWGTFPAMGPIPEGDDSDPAKYALHPWATGPYMFKEYVPEKSLTLVKNPNWDPNTDPGRHQYVDEWDMQFDVPSAKVDQILLNDEGDGQTTLTYDNIQAVELRHREERGDDRLVLGSSPCSYYWGPDYRTVNDMDVRKALAYAYPYQEAWAAGGEIVGVTRVPGTNLMPPGIPGRTEYNPLPDHEPGTTNADKAKQLLQDSGNIELPGQVPVLAGRPDLGRHEGRDRQGSEGRGIRPAAVRDHRRGQLDPAGRPEHRHQRPFLRVVLGLADRLVLVPAGDPVDRHRGGGARRQLLGVQRA